MKTMKLKNIFHNTEASFKSDFKGNPLEAFKELEALANRSQWSCKEGDHQKARQNLARINKKLCVRKNCECGGMVRSA